MVVFIDDLDAIFRLNSAQHGFGIDSQMTLEMSTIAFRLRKKSAMRPNKGGYRSVKLHLNSILLKTLVDPEKWNCRCWSISADIISPILANFRFGCELFRLCSWNIARPLRRFPLVFVCYQYRLLFPPYEVAARIKRRSFAFLENSSLQTLSWIVSLQLRMNIFDSAKATMRTAHQHFYTLKNAFVLVFQQ